MGPNYLVLLLAPPTGSKKGSQGGSSALQSRSALRTPRGVKAEALFTMDHEDAPTLTVGLHIMTKYYRLLHATIAS